MSTDDAVRELIMLFPRLVGRAKRITPPDQLRSFELAPRHLSLLSLLLLDGPQTVSQLAARLEVAPTTVSLLVADLSRKGVLDRREDDDDRRRRIVDITEQSRPAVSEWLSPFAQAWRQVLETLTTDQQRLVVNTLLAYEAAVSDAAS
ncbi:MarR family winged helix-turn-helix transcriptional regulator [Actinoplanes subtropicus]|uniref:MarR family winged helix-turn-helix transcriptional regulator n=1 Tax=Actinoplanes subtropicus TaxID=543632 RepID=UPI0004C2BE03|nr:MarR family winged helix-turn-helix transcriptional regulator [Actinoplanes subtropicus]